MAINTLIYAPTLRRRAHRPAPDFELFDAAVALADEGRALESLHKTFEYLFPGRAIPDLTREPFSFVQGSSRVTVRIEGDDLTASVPLVRLPAGGSAIAAMRYVLTSIAGSGQLYQPRLRGDDVHLEFRDRLTRMHPAKLVEVLQRMPRQADASDDWLIGQFSALPLERADITALDADELARAVAFWSAHWAEVDELIKECQRKRSLFFLNELTAFAYHRVVCVLPLHGLLAARLRESMSSFNDTDEDPTRRESALARCSKEMKVVPAAELARNLGHADYAISPLADGTPAVLQEYLGPGNYMDALSQHRRSGKAIDAALGLFGTYYFLLARYSWPEPIGKELSEGLAAASGKPWREMAGVLFDHATALAEKYEDEDEDEDEDDEDDDEDDEEGEEVGEEVGDDDNEHEES